MAQTVANLADVLKEAWTSDKLEKQFYDKNPLLDRFAKYKAEMVKSKMGEKALVPLHKGRSGGTTTTSSAGGALNPADEQKVDAAEYDLVYNWFQIQMETGVLNQATGGSTSAVDGKMLEIEGAIADMSRSATRQAVSNGDGIIAQCDDGGASTTVELLTTGYGYDAIVRGWLYPGLPVDIGTSADSDSLATGSIITAVKEDATDPDITISDSITTVAATGHFVSIANPNSATARNPELNGLRTIAGSNTSSVGNLDPDTAGEEFWKPAKVDTTTTVFSVDLALQLQRAVHQKTGEMNGEVWTSLKQQENFYSILINQLRWGGEAQLGVGTPSATKWNGMAPNAIPDIPDREWYYLTMSDYMVVSGQGITKPTWVSELQGTNKGLQWVPDTTGFKDAVVWPFNVAIRRRNGSSAAIGLTA